MTKRAKGRDLGFLRGQGSRVRMLIGSAAGNAALNGWGKGLPKCGSELDAPRSWVVRQEGNDVEVFSIEVVDSGVGGLTLGT